MLPRRCPTRRPPPPAGIERPRAAPQCGAWSSPSSTISPSTTSSLDGGRRGPVSGARFVLRDARRRPPRSSRSPVEVRLVGHAAGRHEDGGETASEQVRATAHEGRDQQEQADDVRHEAGARAAGLPRRARQCRRRSAAGAASDRCERRSRARQALAPSRRISHAPSGDVAGPRAGRWPRRRWPRRPRRSTTISMIGTSSSARRRWRASSAHPPRRRGALMAVLTGGARGPGHRTLAQRCAHAPAGHPPQRLARRCAAHLAESPTLALDERDRHLDDP